jgi:hypothetical protein
MIIAPIPTAWMVNLGICKRSSLQPYADERELALLLCEMHGFVGPIARELNPITRCEFDVIVAVQLDSRTAFARLGSRRNVNLLLVTLKKKAESLTQKMTLPKSFPRPQSSPTEGFVSLVHVFDLTNQGPFEEDGLVIVRHLLSEVGSTTRRPIAKERCINKAETFYIESCLPVLANSVS